MDPVCLTVDCADPGRVAAFWSEALRWEAHVAPDGSGAVCRPRSGGVYLEFVHVPEPKTAKNRLHLGCTAGGLDDLDAELDRLLSLGATIAWEEEFPPEVAAHYRNVILRDIEGNEFCLGAGRMPPVASAGDVLVREAAGGDRGRILELAERLAESAPPWRDPTAVERAVADSIAALLDQGNDDNHTAYVAEAGRRVVGFVTIGRRSHFTGVIDASIDDLVVDDAWRGRGIADALLASAEAWANGQSLERITVETVASNSRAARRYRSRGYADEDLRLTKVLRNET